MCAILPDTEPLKARFMLRAVVIVGTFALLGSSAQGEEPYRIAVDAAECLRERVDAYLAEERRDVFLIVLKDCGRRSVDPSSQSTASSGIDGPSIVGGTGEDLIVLTRRQLECLRDTYSDIARPVPINLIELNFSSCSADGG